MMTKCKLPFVIILFSALSVNLYGQLGNYSPILWFKADQGVNSTGYNNGSNYTITTWYDQSNNGWDATSNTSQYKPVYLNTSNTDINYNPTIAFDGTDDYLDLQSNYPTSNSDGMTWYAIAKANTTAGNKTRAFVFDIGRHDKEGFGLAHSSNSSLIYSSTHHDGATSDIFHNHDTTTVLLKLNYNFDLSQELSYNGEYTPSLSTPVEIQELNNSTLNLNSTHHSIKGPFTIGRQSKSQHLSNDNIRAYDGRIAEIIGFSENFTHLQSREIETYLAIKYGITIDNTGYNTGLPLANYRASDGTNIFSLFSHTAYQNEVIGIGRDDGMGLMQKQSHTPANDFRLYISTLASNNINNSGVFPNNTNPENIQFLVCGTNQGAGYATSNAIAEQPSSVVSRLEKEWVIENSNYTGAFNVDIVLNGFAVNNGVNNNDLRLLIDDDGDFSNATSYSSSSGISFILVGNTLKILNIQDSLIPQHSTKYFTVGSVSFGTPLSINLDFFNGKHNASNNFNHLKWRTLSEVNNDFFTIEISEDGIHWKDHVQKTGAGTVYHPMYYQFKHKNVRPGKYYYRLSQTDFNGDRREIGIVIIDVEHKKQLLLYPNPVKDELRVYNSDGYSNYPEIYKLTGEKVDIPFPYKLNKTTLVYNTSNLSKGLYLLRFNGSSTKFIKQ